MTGFAKGFAIVSTSVADASQARELAHHLVEARLAACVQIVPIESVYRWEGAIEDAREHLLLCKIAARDFAAVEAALRAKHGYELPEIVMTAIVAGSTPYLDWLGAATAR